MIRLNSLDRSFDRLRMQDHTFNTFLEMFCLERDSFILEKIRIIIKSMTDFMLLSMCELLFSYQMK